MKCPACGADVVETAVFCHKCGERLGAKNAAQAPALDVADSATLPADALGQSPSDAAADPNATPADKFKQVAASYQGGANESEKALWKGGYSPKAMIGGWAASLLITVVLLILAIWAQFGSVAWIAVVVVILASWLYVLLVLAYRKVTVRYELTSQRFIHQRGFLRHVTDRIEVIDIDDITFTQGPVERMVGVGTIILLSSDRTSPSLTMRGIDNVKQVADLIDDTRRGERRRRGLHIEQI
jgi:membrane protein YdbS with pleckstrin-like domain